MSCPTKRPTSRHKTRSTAPVVLKDGEESREFYLKRVYRVPWKHIAADLIRGRVPQPQPVREFRAVERLMEHQIGVMQPVAYGQERWLGLPRRAFLLVAAVPAPDPINIVLSRWLSPGACDASTPLNRHSIMYELGSFVRRLHDAQFACPDLVGKHVYVKPAEVRADGPRWEFYLIDVERLGATNDSRVHQRELRRLLASMRVLPLGTTDLLRFAAGYAGGEDGEWAARKRALCETFAWSDGLLGKLRETAAHRPRRCDAAMALLQERFVTAGRVTVSERYISALQQHGLNDFRAIFKYQGGRRLDKPGLASWRLRAEMQLAAADGSARTLYLKRFDHPPLTQQIRRIFGGSAASSTAKYEWQQIERLHRAGIPTMVPVAVGEKMRGWFERRSFLAVEAVPGESLERWVPVKLPVVERGSADAEATKLRRDLTREVAKLVSSFHRAGFVHRDLYLSHVFVSFDANGRVVLHLIDLARVFRPKWRRDRWVVKDLAALNFSAPSERISRTDRMRFLRWYLRCDRLDATAKALARRVLAKTRRMARHNDRSGRLAASEAVSSPVEAAPTP